MDESLEPTSPNYSQPGSPHPSSANRPSGSSGLTLVLPALKNGKPLKSTKKSKSKNQTETPSLSGAQDGYGSVQETKILRPVKLKPLKEVLTKLIAQIKKKDDYAFFLKPVDPSRVQGYSDVITHPMDFGTMTTKVARGRYRSLEDFASDIRLVTSNAKLFNPPGTIYHTEAERIEAWGLDHISKSASTVIQYETDWNIEIEKDDDGHVHVNIDDDDDGDINYTNAGTPMDLDDDPNQARRSPSAASQVQPGTSRRGLRGPYKKPTNPNTISESIDADGRLPGSKDGLGAFPPGSDWAETMLALKLKGKRYRTKKERMRIEKEGPPYCADGSLDYTEMEDPFSVLSVFVPDLPSRPYLTSLYPPLSSFPAQPESSQLHTQLHTQLHSPPAPFPMPVNIPLNRPLPTLPVSTTPEKRRHWTVTRNAQSRNKLKDKDDLNQDDATIDTPAWKVPREAHGVDFGSFALLAAELAEEMKIRDIGSGEGEMGEAEKRVFDAIRASVDCEVPSKEPRTEQESGVLNGTKVGSGGYWTIQRAAEAEEYIRDIVYGGVDGLAYLRSLAEFVTSDRSEDPLSISASDSDSNSPSGSGLGMPLAQWVEKTVVDPLTAGRHALLRETALHLRPSVLSSFSSPLTPASVITRKRKRPSEHEWESKGRQSISDQIALSIHAYPSATEALSALQQISTHRIDMGALIWTPEELFLSEEEWAGKIFKERQARTPENGGTIVGTEVDKGEKTWTGMDIQGKANGNADGSGDTMPYELEGPEELNYVLDYSASIIAQLDRSIRDGRRDHTDDGTVLIDGSLKQEEKAGTEKALGVEGTRVNVDMKREESEGEKASGLLHSGNSHQPLSMPPSSHVPTDSDSQPEDPILRNLRLNLLALAKRAPLDTIARLPKDLVPEHIRHFVPTLGTLG